jgi:HAD superfamily hydrolase (TIGR01549 family)
MSILRGVLFDLDDTLTDRSRSIKKFAPELVRRFDLDRSEMAPSEIVRCIEDGDGNGYATRERLCEHLRLWLPWKEVPSMEELAAFWRENFPRCNVEREGVTATLRELQRRGLKLGVISNGAPTQHVKIDVMGLRPFFSVVIVSDDVGIKKPDPRIFRMAMEKLGLDASEVIFVGDNPELDIAGARGVGIRAIWLKCREEKAPENAQSITAFDQLLPICGI